MALVVFFYFRSICFLDNDVSKHQTRNARFRARRADHSTTSMCFSEPDATLMMALVGVELECVRLQNYEYILSEIFITCGT